MKMLLRKAKSTSLPQDEKKKKEKCEINSTHRI